MVSFSELLFFLKLSNFNLKILILRPSLDNSEWMRNGDYTPTRLEAQQDAINLICGAKTQSNPENTVGVIACSGRR